MPVVGAGTAALVVAVACFFPSSWPVTLRIIGVLVCVAFVVYTVSSVGTPKLGDAVIGLLLIGMPSGVMGVTGKHPGWGRGAPDTNGPDQPPPGWLRLS
jgi:hypothetical protein